ncbi:MAG: recombinase family protein [Oscillospiraceae bacterium]|nr:recombinase family protein [Oscillospiraceae bacterium]
MLKNRYIPYGYTMENGDIVIEQSEAKIIRYIFETYIAGATLKDIADRLTAQQVVYSEKKTEWNKARVMRILDNVKYLGDDTFPQIIDEGLFAEAARQKTARQRTTPADTEQEIHVLKGYIVCGKCGCVMKRRVERKCKYKERWYCSNPDCDNNVHIRDTVILKKVQTLTMRMVEDDYTPEERKMPTTDTSDTLKIKSELEDELDRPNVNAQRALELCIELVQIQYEGIQSIPGIRANVREGKENLSQLLERTVDKIILYEDGAAELVTKSNIKIKEGG